MYVKNRNYFDNIGEKHGTLTITGIASTRGYHKYFYCRCDCGKMVEMRVDHVLGGNSKNCGCLRGLHLVTHGDAHLGHRKRLYRIWNNMLQRCKNPNIPEYKWYGKRNIFVCQDWENYIAFKDWAMANGYKNNLTIDRINNDDGYYPDNCRWITASENTRRSALERWRKYRESKEGLKNV